MFPVESLTHFSDKRPPLVHARAQRRTRARPVPARPSAVPALMGTSL